MALWTGIGPNIARNAIINAAELASYDQVKQVYEYCQSLEIVLWFYKLFQFIAGLVCEH